MTLDFEFWLMLCSREGFSFKNVYVSNVGRNPTATHAKVIREIPIRNPVLDDNVKSKEKRQNFKICKPIFLRICNFFQQCFVFSLLW